LPSQQFEDPFKVRAARSATPPKSKPWDIVDNFKDNRAEGVTAHKRGPQPWEVADAFKDGNSGFGAAFPMTSGGGGQYGAQFHAKTTANGETFNMDAMTAAHTTLPMPSLVEVTNLENGRKVVVRVNDRGPFVGDRIIDMSRAAARELDFESKGLARVRVRYLGPAPLGGGSDPGVRRARLSIGPFSLGR
jgi:rare lipoprotein A (peptidoglycan hydrolase)